MESGMKTGFQCPGKLARSPQRMAGGLGARAARPRWREDHDWKAGGSGGEVLFGSGRAKWLSFSRNQNRLFPGIKLDFFPNPCFAFSRKCKGDFHE